MNILVTGGAGFIGSHTCERLVRAGHRVRVADNFSTGKRSNLSALAGDIELIELDIRDFEKLRAAASGMETIIHLAAVASVVRSIEEPLVTQAINATGSLNVIEAARLEDVRRVLLASSAAIYGDDPVLPTTEDSPIRPITPYAWQKLSSEFYGQFYGAQHGTEFLSLRYFNVYGPRQDPASPYSGVLSIFTERATGGRSLIIYGDGRQTRDFIHVSDVAEINRLGVEATWPLPQIINVATGRETQIIDAARIILEAAGAADADSCIEFEPARPGDIRRSFATSELMVKTFGYRPQVAVAAGLEELVALQQDG
jgi:UDP-glucose 4-epimerase